MAALIANARKEYSRESTQFEKAKIIYDAKKDSIKIQIRDVIKNNQDPSSIAMPEKPAKPSEKRYMTNAGSVERLIRLLEQNPEGIIQSRDELTGWLRSMDSSYNQDARAFYIESWNGTGSSFSYDTVTHGHLFCETGPCVSVMGTIQPGPLSQIVASADRGDMGDDGLLQRFQLMIYPDKILSWEYHDRQPDKIASNAMKNIFKIVSWFSGDLRFDEQAQPIFIKWYSDLMLRAQNELHPGLESHLSKYPQLMPSLALLIHVAEFASTLNIKQCDIKSIVIPPVSEEAASKATEWCKYLESHARRIYAMGENAGVDAAKTLLQRAVDGKLPNPFKACEVQRKKWAGLSESGQVKKAIELLETYGWAKVEILQTGGRPSIVCHIHPDAKKHIKNAVSIRD